MSDQDAAAHAQQLLSFIHMMMAVLSHRMMSILALLLGFGISLYALIVPDVYRTVVSGLFWVLAYLPALWVERSATK